MNDTTTNKSLTFYERSFLLEQEHKAELEKNFTPNCLDEYRDTNHNIFSSVLSMIKDGRPFSISDNKVFIEIQSKRYSINYKEFVEDIGKDNYKAYILPYEEREKQRIEKERMEKIRKEEERLAAERKKLNDEEERLIKEKYGEKAAEHFKIANKEKGGEIAELRNMIMTLQKTVKGDGQSFLEPQSLALPDNSYGKVDELEEQVASLKNQLNTANNNHRNETNKLNKEIAELRAYKESASDNDVSSLKERINTLNNTISAKDKIIADYKKKINEDTDINDKIKELTAENELLTNDKNSLEKENENAKNKIKSLTDKLNELNRNKDSFQSLNEKINELERLAYHDHKTSAYSVHSFNKDFADIPLGHMILALIDVPEIEDVNNLYGINSGDKMLSVVVNELNRAFAGNKVYRTYGAKFAVIIQNNTLNNVKGQLSDVVLNLKKQDINIYYGTGVGNECKDHFELIDKATEDKKQMIEYAGSYDEASKIRESLSINNQPKVDNNSKMPTFEEINVFGQDDDPFSGLA